MSPEHAEPAHPCLSLVEMLPRLRAPLDDPFWGHVRRCGRCVQAAVSLDPDVMVRSIGGDTLRPSVIEREVYDDLVPLARGGMYQTWTTVDRRLGRRVVIKGLPVGDHDPAQRQLLDACLRREALVLANLQHPSIVTLLEAGQWRDGETFYAMELVEGVTLRQEIDARPTLRERLDLLPALTSVVRAIAYSHQRNIIHRDLNPNNILVGKGSATVIDWTTAKRMGPIPGRDALVDAAELPETGPTLAAIGTPGYAPAEQATPDHDRRVDIFALGATLQFLVTGRRPFEGASNPDILANIAAGRRAPIDDCPPELAAIIAKATTPHPDDRYQSADELADDLQRFQSDQLVLAYRYTAFERFVHSRCFRPLLIGLLVLLIGVAGVAGTMYYRGRSIDAERSAAEERRQTLTANELKQRADAAAAEAHQKTASAEEQRQRFETSMQGAVDLARDALTDAARRDASAEQARARMQHALARMKQATEEAEQQRDLARRSEGQAEEARLRAINAEREAAQARLAAEIQLREATVVRDRLRRALDDAIAASSRIDAELAKVRGELAESRIRNRVLERQHRELVEQRGRAEAARAPEQGGSWEKSIIFRYPLRSELKRGVR